MDKETPDAHDQRNWREKLHYSADKPHQVFIPAMALKQAVDRAAAMLGMQIQGRGKATYTKYFLSGCIVKQNVPIFIDEGHKRPILKSDVEPERIYCNADGKRGSGKRVWRTFPTMPKWNASAEFVIFDDIITKPIFEKHVIQAGSYVGIGRFRAELGGLNGRFSIAKFNWADVT